MNKKRRFKTIGALAYAHAKAIPQFDLTVDIWMACGLPRPEKEFRFCPDRRWRADYAFPEHKVLVECEGAIWVQGRHTRGSGFVKDMEKYNTAASMGFRLLRFQPADLTKTATIELIKKTLNL